MDPSKNFWSDSSSAPSPGPGEEEEVHDKEEEHQKDVGVHPVEPPQKGHSLKSMPRQRARIVVVSERVSCR